MLENSVGRDGTGNSVGTSPGSDEAACETAAVRTSWRELGVHRYVKVLIIGGLFVWVFRQEVRGIVRQWIVDPNWSHGFLIPLFSLYFITQRKAEILNEKFRPNYLGLFCLLCGLLAYLVVTVKFTYGYLRPIDMIATVGAVVLFMGGWRLVKYMWLPVVFLVFAVPLPDRYYVSLTMPMRHLAASIAGILLAMVRGMETMVNGVVIDVIYRGQRLDPPLNVAEACSGMRLLMAFLALGVAMAYLHYRPVWQRLVLLAATIPIAVFCNIVRVTATGFIYVLLHPRYAQGIYHTFLGLAMLPLAFGLYGFIAWFMSSLFTDECEVVGDVVIRRREKN
ncbi:MAG: exosortase/archaeosortase family protein [Planctomycetota bacterium]|jgi:exosortase